MGNKKTLRLVRALLLIIIAACLAKIGQAYSLSRKNAAQQAELKQIKNNGSQSQENEPGMTEAPETRPAESFAALSLINSDLAGWLSIEGTTIDCPVMQCDDDMYYLNHDFYRNENNHGCLFVKNFVDIASSKTSFVIYGHNMKDGSMFGELDHYKSQSFFKDHPLISFETPDETRTYEVMAAFYRDLTEDGFAYYDFYQADDEAEFLNFYENAKKLSLYDTNVTAEWGDTFLSLSTCDYHATDGRFVVVAKRARDTE